MDFGLTSVRNLFYCLGCGWSLQENMRVLAEKWINMRPARKETYERQAEMHACRYKMEVDLEN